MSVVPRIPVSNVPQKPSDPKPSKYLGLVIAYPLNQASGAPQDITGHTTATGVATNWPVTPWGRGVSLTSPLALSGYNVSIPVTYHVLFKPSFSDMATPTDILIFGEVDGTGRIVSGVGLEWQTQGQTAFTFAAYSGSVIHSFTPVEPIEHEWYAVTYTFDGLYAELYINGVPAFAEQHTVFPIVGAHSWTLGGNGFNGIIADARVYNRVLSEQEVARISSSPSMWIDYTEDGGKPITGGLHMHRSAHVLPGGAVYQRRRINKILRR